MDKDSKVNKNRGKLDLSNPVDLFNNEDGVTTNENIKVEPKSDIKKESKTLRHKEVAISNNTKSTDVSTNVKRTTSKRSKKKSNSKPNAKKVGRIALKTLKILLLSVLVIGLLAGSLLFIQVKPMLDESRKIAYDKLSSVGKNTFTLMENTKVYDTNGDLLKEIKSNNYKYTEISKVSKYVQDGYIAVEDRNFLSHNGIDFKALTRAGITLIKNDGAITQGGSTITQQVIKNMLLTQERTFKRKLIEFFLAPEIEKKYSKADIMEFYVNTNYYGNGCYGVYSASKYYFGKTPDKLTLGESALLVGISNNPSKYDPVRNPKNAISKRNSMLNKMLEVGVITEQECASAKNEELDLVLEQMVSDGKEDYMVSYAIHSAALMVMELDGFKFKYGITDESTYEAYQKDYNQKYSEASSLIRSGGYKIYTSFDVEKQELLQKSLDDKLKGFKEKDDVSGKYTMQGAGVLVNNETGLVEAMVGGRGTEDGYNRGFLATRQPGSAIKPLVDYGPAFDTGAYYPSYVMEDKAINKGPNNAYSGYRGNMTLRDAIKISTNTIPYRILLDLSPKVGLEYLGKMKFDTLVPSDNVGSLALGGITRGVRVVDMAKAYSTIANGGVYMDNTCITKLEYGNTGVIYDGAVKKTKVYSEDTSYMLVDTLKGVLEQGGTGAKYKLEKANAFAKTGTTDNSKDSYLVGSTPYYTLAVWTGYDMPKRIESIKEGYPGQIWKEVMDTLHERLPESDFTKPSTIITSNVSADGSMTSNSTGVRDIFSQVAIDKQKELAEQREKEQLIEVEKQWKEADKERQQTVEILLADFEAYRIKSTSDLETIDLKYRELKTAIGMISDKTKKMGYQSRLDIKKALLDRERQVWEELLAQEEANRNQALKDKAEAEELAKKEGLQNAKNKLISQAKTALNILNNLTASSTNKYKYYAQAEDAVNRCMGYDEFNSLNATLKSHKTRLNIAGLVIETPKPPTTNGEDSNNSSSSNDGNDNNTNDDSNSSVDSDSSNNNTDDATDKE